MKLTFWQEFRLWLHLRLPSPRRWLWTRRGKPIPGWAQPQFRVTARRSLDAHTDLVSTAWCWTPWGRWAHTRPYRADEGWELQRSFGWWRS